MHEALQLQLQKVDSERVARLIGWAFHPFLVSPLAIFLIVGLDAGVAEAVRWALWGVAFVIAPASLYIGQKLKRGKYTHADVPERQNRTSLYLFGGFCVAAYLAFLVWQGAPRVLLAGVTAGGVANVVAMMVNRLGYKVSIHAGVPAGVAVALAYFSWPLAVAMGAITVALAWARTVTKNHTWGQVVAAWGIAAACTVGIFGTWVG